MKHWKPIGIALITVGGMAAMLWSQLGKVPCLPGEGLVALIVAAMYGVVSFAFDIKGFIDSRR